MPKDHVNLPERTERRRLIRDFKNAAEGTNIAGHEAYVRAVDALNAKLEP